MSREYVIKSAQRRDEWQSQYGTMVDYALALEGVEGWVKLSQKLETQPPVDGGTIYGDITQAETKNGTPYQRFKKQNPNYDGANRSENQNSQANHKIDYIVQMLEELTGRRDVVDHSNSSASVSQEELANLDDIFGLPPAGN